MKKTLRHAKTLLTITIFTMALSACLPIDEEKGGDEAAAAGLAISFTNPSNTDYVQTPNIVINLTGTVTAKNDVDSVKWHNDRGGKGDANGTKDFATGNIVLQLGSNVITVTAMDVSGAKTSSTITVERENTAPSPDPLPESDPELFYSYSADLSNAAPVKNAEIIRGPVWFFADPGDTWQRKGLESIRISCCKGIAGPGQGDGYSTHETVTGTPWVAEFDISQLDVGGTRRARLQSSFTDGTSSGNFAFDFRVGGSEKVTNTAPLISGVPQPRATASVQYSFRPVAEDPDGDTMTFSIANKPRWASFGKSNGRLYGTPLASDVGVYRDIVISVSDGQTRSSLPPFSIEVEAVSGGSATISWTIPTERTDNSPLNNLAGFNLYYGQSPGDYANKIDVTNAGTSRYVVDNLTAGSWYFVVTAYDKNGLESNPSNEGRKSF